MLPVDASPLELADAATVEQAASGRYHLLTSFAEDLPDLQPQSLVPHHMDRDFATSLGLKDVLVIEHLKLAYVANMLEDWLGEDGWISRIDVRFPLLDFVGSTLTSRGRLISRSTDGARPHATCRVWVQDQTGAIGTTGTATIIQEAP